MGLNATAMPARPLRFRHIFIVTYGRSGSTLLNGVLNAIPGVCVRGENDNTLFRIYNALLAAEETVKRAAPVPTHPWYGPQFFDMAGYRHRLIDAFLEDRKSVV